MTRNSKTDWGWLAKVFHWAGAAIILILLVHGWWMTHMTPRPERLANYAWHSALGYDLFVILILRLLWRWLNPVPELPVGLQRWEHVAARLSHAGLYVLMFIVSLTGWMVATTFRRWSPRWIGRCGSGSRSRIWLSPMCSPRWCSSTSSPRCVTTLSNAITC